MCFEESYDPGQILQATNPEFESISVVNGDRPAAEERLQFAQDSLIPAVLDNSELGQDLPSQSHRRLAINRDVEATFSVNESDDPPRIQPFLLITCTQRFVTGQHTMRDGILLCGRRVRKYCYR